MLLAASKKVSDQFRYIAFDREDTKESDIRVAQQLGDKLSIDVEIVEPPAVSEEFREQIEAAFCSSRRNKAQANIQQYIEKKGEYVITSGIVSEVARTRYEHPTREISVEVINELMNLPQTEYSHRELTRWVESAKAYEDESRINAYDLLLWEQKDSNWGARAAREIDLVCEFAVPFANRELLHTLLTTPVEHRRPPEYQTSREIIRTCWPECEEIPINPNESISDMLKSYIKNRSQTSPLHNKIETIYKKMKH